MCELVATMVSYRQIHLKIYFCHNSVWVQGSYVYMYKYIQDATVPWLLFQELYMFRAFTMPIIRSNITAKAAVGKCSIQ
jgi:hypothetical protein